MLSQFLRDVEKHEDFDNSQEHSMSKSLSQDLVITSSEEGIFTGYVIKFRNYFT